jgi:hypothetical protein
MSEMSETKKPFELKTILRSDVKKMSENQQNYEYVNHPQHYGGGDNTYEVIKVIEATEMDFHLGNAYKYIARAGKKETNKEVQDLRKAIWYIERKIQLLENGVKD